MSAGIRLDVDGHSAYVSRGGVVWQGGARPRVMLVHGAGMDHTVWVLLGRWLARHGYDVIIPDLPGHGHSAGEALSSIEAMSDWLLRVLAAVQQHSMTAEEGGNQLGEGPLTVMGHSMGSLVALELAKRLDATRLVLLGAGYPMRVGPPLLEAAERNDPLAADMITAYGHAYASQLGHNPLPGIPVANLARVLLLRARAGVLHADLAACDQYRGLEDAVGLPPVHMIAGRQDRMTPPKACQALADRIQAASVQWLPDSGHMMMTEYAEATLAAVRRALD